MPFWHDNQDMKKILDFLVGRVPNQCSLHSYTGFPSVQLQRCVSYLGRFGEIDLANSILGHFQNPAGFREDTFTSNTAYTAVAFFVVAAKLLEKLLWFRLFFLLYFDLNFRWKTRFYMVLFELRSRNPKLQLVVLITIVTLLHAHIFITDTLAWICIPATVQRNENPKITVILTENTPWWGARSRRRNTWSCAKRSRGMVVQVDI